MWFTDHYFFSLWNGIDFAWTYDTVCFCWESAGYYPWIPFGSTGQIYFSLFIMIYLGSTCAKLLNIWNLEILVLQKEDLRKIMELLVISEQHARTLLIHYRWDVERIFELLEQKGKERLFSEAGVTIIQNKGIDLLSSSSMYTCDICFEDVRPDSVTQMDCGHLYCNICKFFSLL